MSDLARESMPSILRQRSFGLFWLSRVLSIVAFQALTVGVGWQMYELTGDPLDLGLVGLVQFLPIVVLTLVVGHVANRYDRRLILGALSLDLFVVLLGGATALLPIYARDVLETGPWGLGLLRAAPGVGALAVAVVLAGRPLRHAVGPSLFAAVLIFGLATVVFGLSTSMPLSLAALAVLGAANVVSVVIRWSLIQLRTPDAMRGRVSAASSMFTGTSNQLGDFESGLTAALFGAVPAVLIGGIGTVAVALLWMYLFPSLRRVRTLEG